MKKIFIVLGMLLVLFPYLVKADTCDTRKVFIKSINIINEEGFVEEKNEATINDKNINLDLSMSNVGDAITYKIVVENTSQDDFEIDNKSIKVKSNYFDYSLEDNDSVVVKANSTKEFYLKAGYKNEVPATMLSGDTYSEKEDIVISLSSFTNPKTGTIAVYIIIIGLMASVFGYYYLIKQSRMSTLGIVLCLILIPSIVTAATCSVTINIKSNIEIVKIAEFDTGPNINNKIKALINYREEEGPMSSNGKDYSPSKMNSDTNNLKPSDLVINSIGEVISEPFKSFLRSNTLPDNIRSSAEEQIQRAKGVTVSDEEVNNIYSGLFNGNDTIISLDNSQVTFDTFNLRIIGNTLFYCSTAETCIDEETFKELLKNKNTSVKVIDSNTFIYTYDNQTDSIKKLSETEIKEYIREYLLNQKKNAILDNVFSSEDSDYIIYGWYDNNDEAIYYYCEKENIYLNKDSSEMFMGLVSLNTLTGIENVNTSRVIDMNRMFFGVGSESPTLNLNLSKWNTSKVMDMSSMFQDFGHKAATVSLNLSGFNTSKVFDMNSMFAQSLYHADEWNVEGLSNFNTSKVVNMSFMFSYAGYEVPNFNLNLSKWNTSKVASMTYMFDHAGYKSGTWSIGDLSAWDTSNVTNMKNMFTYSGHHATTWSLGDLSHWNVSKVIFMNSMFEYAGYRATTWNIGDISSWNTISLVNAERMFSYVGYNATTWSLGDLSHWNTSNLAIMNHMFYCAGYNATTWRLDLSNWNTSKVTKMDNLFYSSGYNATTWSVGDLSHWNVSKVTDFDDLFHDAGYSATTWGVGDLSAWDTSNVTSMYDMFFNAGHSATTWNSIGTLNIYTGNINNLMREIPNAKATLNIYKKPVAFNGAFYLTATGDSAEVIVNYTSEVDNINSVIVTQSPTSHVIKGVVLDADH